MKRNQKWNESQDNDERMEKALKKLARLVAHIDRLRIERNRIRKRNQPKQKSELKVTGEEYTKIRHQDFGDTAHDLF